MSIFARRDPTTGRLSDIADRAQGPNDVPIDVIPDPRSGPWIYDAANRAAVPDTLTQSEKLDRASVPVRLLAALALRSSASWATLAPAKQLAAQKIIDDAAAQIVALLG
jgi:hypothetical protein